MGAFHQFMWARLEACSGSLTSMNLCPSGCTSRRNGRRQRSRIFTHTLASIISSKLHTTVLHQRLIPTPPYPVLPQGKVHLVISQDIQTLHPYCSLSPNPFQNSNDILACSVVAHHTLWNRTVDGSSSEWMFHRCIQGPTSLPLSCECTALTTQLVRKSSRASAYITEWS